MTHGFDILARLGWPLLAAGDVTPTMRWEAVYRHANSIRVNPWWIAFWALLAVVSCVGGVLVHRFIDRRRRFTRRLRETIARLKLPHSEGDLLGMLARHSGLPNPESVLVKAEAFDHAAAGLLLLPRVQALNESARQQVRTVIEDLRKKLGFHLDPAAADGRILSSRQIAPGSRITLARPDQIEAYDALVDRNTSVELTARIDPEFHARRGDSLAMQYTHGRNTWELIVPVVDTLTNGLVLGHSRQSRLVNRRRFVRVRVNHDAMAAPLPFHPGEEGAHLPTLFPARLTEIAGPGVCLECGFAASPGDALIVRAKIQDMQLQTTARVRRATDLGQGRYLIAAEMIGLESDEIAELVRRTNEALQGAATAERTPAPVHAAAAGWRSNDHG
ncbi:MAG: hypothetical protein NTV86_19610 [Planctomycetota bacterium]|nr:hypothetical protein [Planctomycetota bacterium]